MTTDASGVMVDKSNQRPRSYLRDALAIDSLERHTEQGCDGRSEVHDRNCSLNRTARQIGAQGVKQPVGLVVTGSGAVVPALDQPGLGRANVRDRRLPIPFN